MDEMRQQLDNVPGEEVHPLESEGVIKSVPTDKSNMQTSMTQSKQIDKVVGEDQVNSKIKLNSETHDGSQVL